MKHQLHPPFTLFSTVTGMEMSAYELLEPSHVEYQKGSQAYNAYYSAWQASKVTVKVQEESVKELKLMLGIQTWDDEDFKTVSSGFDVTYLAERFEFYQACQEDQHNRINEYIKLHGKYDGLTKPCTCPRFWFVRLLPEKKYPIAGYAPGSYMCTCCICKVQFQGDKRATMCEPCAVKAVPEKVKTSSVATMGTGSEDEEKLSDSAWALMREYAKGKETIDVKLAVEAALEFNYFQKKKYSQSVPEKVKEEESQDYYWNDIIGEIGKPVGLAILSRLKSKYTITRK